MKIIKKVPFINSGYDKTEDECLKALTNIKAYEDTVMYCTKKEVKILQRLAKRLDYVLSKPVKTPKGYAVWKRGKKTFKGNKWTKKASPDQALFSGHKPAKGKYTKRNMEYWNKVKTPLQAEQKAVA